MTPTEEILDRLISLPTVSADSNLAVIGFIEDFLSSRRFKAQPLKLAFSWDAGAGVPTLVCGPGSMDQGHKPDEFIETSELAACDAMCDRILQHLSE